MFQARRLHNTNHLLVTKSKKETELVQKWVKFIVKKLPNFCEFLVLLFFLYEVCIHHGTKGYLPLGMLYQIWWFTGYILIFIPNKIEFKIHLNSMGGKIPRFLSFSKTDSSGASQKTPGMEKGVEGSCWNYKALWVTPNRKLQEKLDTRLITSELHL